MSSRSTAARLQGENGGTPSGTLVPDVAAVPVAVIPVAMVPVPVIPVPVMPVAIVPVAIVPQLVRTDSSAADAAALAAADPSADDSTDDDDGEDPDSEEQNVSLAAMEYALLPQMLVIFEKITLAYKRLHRVQVQRLDAVRRGDEPKPALEKRFVKLRRELALLLQDVHLHNIRIEELVAQLYELNRRLIGLEARLLRLALDCRVKREEFLEHHRAQELTPDWLEHVGRLPAKGWSTFVTRHGTEVCELRRQDQPSPTTPPCRSASSAASSRRCRKASARRARQRRR